MGGIEQQYGRTAVVLEEDLFFHYSSLSSRRLVHISDAASVQLNRATYITEEESHERV
jgi:hypothetical protein